MKLIFEAKKLDTLFLAWKIVQIDFYAQKWVQTQFLSLQNFLSSF